MALSTPAKGVRVAARPAESNGASLDALRLRCLLDCAQVLNSSLELPVVLDRILTQAMGVLQAENGSVLLLDSARQQLEALAAHGPRAEQVLGRSQRVGRGVAGWVALHGTPLRLSEGPPEISALPVCERPDAHDALCAPLVADGEVLGVVCLTNRLVREPFGDADLELLTALAHQAGLAVRNARLFEETRRQRETVARLLNQVVTAQDEERGRLVAELHDGPAQTLFAALRALDAAGEQLQDAPERPAELLGTARRNARQAVSELRALMLEVRPLGLDDLGLLDGLAQFARHFEQRSGLAIQVTRRGVRRRLPAAVESALYRIAREALLNVWKHAGASRATVLLQLDEGRCVLEVQDDGAGCVPGELEAADRSDSLGLPMIRERAEMMGGQFEFESSPGSGTVVRVTVPF